VQYHIVHILPDVFSLSRVQIKVQQNGQNDAFNTIWSYLYLHQDGSHLKYFHHWEEQFLIFLPADCTIVRTDCKNEHLKWYKSFEQNLFRVNPQPNDQSKVCLWYKVHPKFQRPIIWSSCQRPETFGCVWIRMSILHKEIMFFLRWTLNPFPMGRRPFGSPFNFSYFPLVSASIPFANLFMVWY